MLNEYGVSDVAVFGSYARGEETERSDIDILVNFKPDAHIGLIRFLGLRRNLENALGARVDLTTPDGLHKGLKDKILAEAVHA